MNADTKHFRSGRRYRPEQFFSASVGNTGNEPLLIGANQVEQVGPAAVEFAILLRCEYQEVIHSVFLVVLLLD